jgi:hypothetical protein
MEERKRLSFWSVDKQTGSLLAIIGIPCEVPVPKKVIFKSFLSFFIETKVR